MRYFLVSDSRNRRGHLGLTADSTSWARTPRCRSACRRRAGQLAELDGVADESMRVADERGDVMVEIRADAISNVEAAGTDSPPALRHSSPSAICLRERSRPARRSRSGPRSWTWPDTSGVPRGGTPWSSATSIPLTAVSWRRRMAQGPRSDHGSGARLVAPGRRIAGGAGTITASVPLAYGRASPRRPRGIESDDAL